MQKQKILIVDDSEMNRAILADMLEDEFDIVEAEHGRRAVEILQKRWKDFSLVLLDIVMPVMDGFEVLALMNQYRWIEDLPVIMISAESMPASVERAYNLGVTDYINRPFDARIVHRRTVNTITLYEKRKKLISMVADQIYEKEKASNLMIEILSHIVEFRNGESGLHVLHIHILTSLLANRLLQKTDCYSLQRSDVSLIANASALHDIGKIAIPESILNKPGKLTKEEFDVIKTHAAKGAEMLEWGPFRRNEPLIRTAYEICRWHHERYDGRGYPDGLKGDEIPISAQIVSLADVYDALTSVRVYKPAISHEKAIEMILNNECGVFNPILLECMLEIADDLKEALNRQPGDISRTDNRNMTEEMLRQGELSASDRTMKLLEHERAKYQFFESMSREVQFEIVVDPEMLKLSKWGAEYLGLNEIFLNPSDNDEVLQVISRKDIGEFIKRLHNATPESPVVEYDCTITVKGECRRSRLVSRVLWNGDEQPVYIGAIGKVVDINEEYNRITTLEKMAAHDSLTGLLNQRYVKKRIEAKLYDDTIENKQYLLILFDLDHFKNANDQYGHMFGNEVLIYVSNELQKSVRSSDLTARVGGDEFLIFVGCGPDVDAQVHRIYQSLIGQYDEFKISVSMGIARFPEHASNYEGLFHAADQALYAAKRAGRGRYCFYDDTMQDMFSALSPIDSDSHDR